MVYCAESRSLAALEVLVHAEQNAPLAAITWLCIPAKMPADLVEKPSRYPDDWRLFPHSTNTQAFGAEWIRSRRSAVLRIPSAVVPGEFNYLLNPAHPDFKRVKIGEPESFSFDPRLG
jgi:RES domain-containing protein